MEVSRRELDKHMTGCRVGLSQGLEAFGKDIEYRLCFQFTHFGSFQCDLCTWAGPG